MAISSTEAVPSTPDPKPISENDILHVFWHEGMLKHDTGRGVFDTGMDPGFLDVLENHPENSNRVKNMVSILKRGPIAPFVSWHQGRPALISELLSFHTQGIFTGGISELQRIFICRRATHPKDTHRTTTPGLPTAIQYINELVEADKDEGKIICSGTFLNPGSWDAALLAAGTTLSAMKHILDGHANITYALVRPPGHHAQPTQADGYCFLNNAGLAVQLALSSGLKNVAVIDIDVHYGNGTAEGFYRSDRVLTVSLHMNHGSWGPSHPQNGTVDELGEDKGFGYNLNIPLPNGSGDRGYAHAMNELVVPAVKKFEPAMMVLVVGQDSSAVS
ncbi:hypothetical protein DH2020_020998 [Rehmannia glutinosa]|uniref:Histone deacetylase domain-containing protein n=1 Tax=Rehmannia glutinosa TaxID=99300 RepID=A0ABR0W9R1_REHGL